MTYKQSRIKIVLEQVLIYPLILIGKVIGLLSPLKHKSQYFLFFPSDAIGGATKVNADILSVLADHSPTVIFSKNYSNHGFAKYFQLPGVHIIDLRKKIDNKATYFVNIIYRGILSTWINRSDAKVVFGGEAIYFYKVIPYLNRKMKIVELCHLPTWLNYSQAFVKYIDLRVVSTPKLKRNILNQYKVNNVPDKYLARISFVDNWVDVPELIPHTHDGLNVLFVGRGAPQKRVHLISQIAENVLKQERGIRFTFVGDVTTLLSEYVIKKSTIYEFIDDKELLYSLYNKADILILTSAYEGLPIVVMDMMVRGKVVLSTAVDGIPDYIVHRETGLLIEELTDEGEIVKSGTDFILEMNNNRQLLKAIGENAYSFAKERFLKESFERSYKAIFNLRHI